MLTGYERVSTTEQNLGLQHDDRKPAFDASVDQTNGTSLRAWWSVRSAVQGSEGTRLPAVQRSPGASD
jgi:hypothetical protein